MSEFTLQVKPEELKQQASVFEGIVKEISANFDEFQRIGRQTKGYWIGEAGDQSRLGCASYQAEMDAVLKRLSEHPTDLLKIAGLYSEAEAAAADISASLRIDEIV